MANLPIDLSNILQLASRSPSGHNTQPWRVRLLAPNTLLVRSNQTRWLPEVDPSNRELVLSLAAFAETLVQAAEIEGLHADLELIANHRTDIDFLRVTFSPSPSIATPGTELIRQRASTRTPYSTQALEPQQVQELTRTAPELVSYFALDSPEGQWLAQALLEAIRQQTWNDSKQRELAAWLRFSRSEIKQRGDGLTAEALGLSPLARILWYTFFKPSTALSPSFRNSGVRAAQGQLRSCAGFIIIRSRDESLPALLESGRIYQRVGLTATKLRMAHHTMSQLMEEEPWSREIQSALQSSEPIQFVLRVGHARTLGRPSIRQPIHDFVE